MFINLKNNITINKYLKIILILIFIFLSHFYMSLKSNLSFTSLGVEKNISPLSFLSLETITRANSLPEQKYNFSFSIEKNKEVQNQPFYKENNETNKKTVTTSMKTSTTINNSTSNSEEKDNINITQTYFDEDKLMDSYNFVPKSYSLKPHKYTNFIKSSNNKNSNLFYGNLNYQPKVICVNKTNDNYSSEYDFGCYYSKKKYQITDFNKNFSSYQINEAKNNQNQTIEKALSEINEKAFEYLLKPFNNKSFIPTIYDDNKDNLPNEKLYFYKKLSENILSFSNKILQENEEIFPLKKKILMFVYNIIIQAFKSSLKEYHIINIAMYGSQASGLSLPESDIDLLVLYDEGTNCTEKILNELFKIFKVYKQFKSVLCLPKATIPLIKLEYINDSGDGGNNDFSDVALIHIDISFLNLFPNKQIRFIPSILIVKYIQICLECLPPSKSVILLLKKYLKNMGLNNYYTGGLSSYSLFLLVFSFYKYSIKKLGNDIVNNFYIGQFLIQLLDFYSKFDFKNYIVDINKENPFYIKENKNSANKPVNMYKDIIVILDPYTLNNVASGSFRINEVQNSFAILKKRLNSQFEQAYNIKNLKKKYSYNTFNISNNNKYYHKYNFCNYNSYKAKELIDTDDFFNKSEFNNCSFNYNSNFFWNKSVNSYNSVSQLRNDISFEQYEKDLDIYNNNLPPNFVESSIIKTG